MLLIDLFLLRPEAYRHPFENPRAPLFVSAFLLLTGVVYGTLVAFFQRTLGGEMAGVPVAEIPLWILFAGNVLAGLVITVAVHGGLTLLIWLMAKGVGGPGLLIGLYRAAAYLLPLSLPALPLIALTSAAAGRPVGQVPLLWLYEPLAGLGLALFLLGQFMVYRVTQGVSARKAALATAMFGLFSLALFLVLT